MVKDRGGSLGRVRDLFGVACSGEVRGGTSSGLPKFGIQLCSGLPVREMFGNGQSSGIGCSGVFGFGNVRDEPGRVRECSGRTGSCSGMSRRSPKIFRKFLEISGISRRISENFAELAGGLADVRGSEFGMDRVRVRQ